MADFKGNRNITQGINIAINPLIQIMMWNMIDHNISKGLEMDYLQIFELKPDREVEKYQEIIHTQEKPERKDVVVVNFGIKPVLATIFVIDSNEYVTMMLAEEY